MIITMVAVFKLSESPLELYLNGNSRQAKDSLIGIVKLNNTETSED